MFDLDKCRKQGWKVLVHTNKGWQVGNLCFWGDASESMSAEFFVEMNAPDVANLPDGPTDQKDDECDHHALISGVTSLVEAIDDAKLTIPAWLASKGIGKVTARWIGDKNVRVEFYENKEKPA